MKVYQLKLKDLNIVLEPVFNTMEAAKLFQNKYVSRKIEIKEVLLDGLDDTNYVYRIETIGEDGVYLEDELFSSLELARESIKNNQRVVKENIINANTFKYALSEAV